MSNKKMAENYLNLKIDTDELTPNQVRLIKSINSMIMHVITTNQEEEFFDGSADLMRMCAALIKQARFIDLQDVGEIPYGEQALEYSVDILKEHMDQSKVVTYDN